MAGDLPRLPLITFGLSIAALAACTTATYRITATVTPAAGIAGPATDFLGARGYVANLESMGPVAVFEHRRDSILDRISVARHDVEGDWTPSSTGRFTAAVTITIEARSFVNHGTRRGEIPATAVVRAHADSLLARLVTGSRDRSPAHPA